MSILQISKIQVRSGNLDDLPQLSVGEFGWATDAKRLFIGNDPNTIGPIPDNTEIITENNLPSIHGSGNIITNTAVGTSSLYSNTTGTNNTGLGYRTLYNNITGNGNTAISSVNSLGVYSPVFNPTTENNRFCMGSTSVTNAYIQVAWTVVSDARDKTEFSSVPLGLDFVTKLQPVAYRFRVSRDSEQAHGPVRYGFKAQDVLALEGDTPVIIDNEDEDKLRFNDQSMMAVLVNAIKEQQSIIEKQSIDITALKIKVGDLEKIIIS